MSPVLSPADVGGPLGERATLLQVSTAFCAPCRAARRVLARVADAVPGVRHVEVDVADAPALAAALEVTGTPTVVVLDASGAVVLRAEGVPTARQVVAALASVLPDDPGADGAGPEGAVPGASSARTPAPRPRSVGGTPTRDATSVAPSARTAVSANAAANGPGSV